MLVESCPTCGTKLKETGDPIYFRCNECGTDWTLEDLEFEPVQKNLGDWIK